MTVADSGRRISYTGTGANTALAVPFPFFEASDLAVYSRVTATGATTLLTRGVHYTVTDPATPPGAGTVTPINGAVDFPGTVVWRIVRTIPRVQEVDYEEHDAFPASSHEQALDRLALTAQELDDDLARAVRFPVSDDELLEGTLPPAEERAGLFLAFDADGAPIALAGVVPDDVIVSAFGETLVDDSDAAEARTTLSALEDPGGGAAGDYLRQSVGGPPEWNTLGADEVSFDPAVSLYAATDVQAALDERHTSRVVAQKNGDEADAGVETVVSGLTNLTIPGANGARIFRAMGQLLVQTAGAVNFTMRVRCGVNGDVTDAIVWEGAGRTSAAAPVACPIVIPRFVPPNGGKLSVTFWEGGSTIRGDASVLESYIVVELV